MPSNRGILRSFQSLLLLAFVWSIPPGIAEPAATAEERDFKKVSLVQLIANPEKYDGQYVTVRGVAYFDSKYYINAIYLTRNDKRGANSPSAVFLYFAPSIRQADHLNDQFVFVRGKFQANAKGHLQAFSSSLVDVDLVRAVKVRIK